MSQGFIISRVEQEMHFARHVDVFHPFQDNPFVRLFVRSFIHSLTHSFGCGQIQTEVFKTVHQVPVSPRKGYKYYTSIDSEKLQCSTCTLVIFVFSSIEQTFIFPRPLPCSESCCCQKSVDPVEEGSAGATQLRYTVKNAEPACEICSLEALQPERGVVERYSVTSSANSVMSLQNRPARAIPPCFYGFLVRKTSPQYWYRTC